ncbi:unnamed protein product [Strongylus vulgaris]|uniref:Uncharacterized protein n=1 Tax=Strongylus vulgaris TaxID=40348 RepID=A0A3P7J0F7_STRVU|nr:unnamed protein product [Strongylus vulgaris]
MDQDHSSESTHHRRLREMFRLFQRSKKQKEKTKESSNEEEPRESKSPPPPPPPVARPRRIPSPEKVQIAGVRSPVQGRARSPSKERSRSSFQSKKLGSIETATTVEEDETIDESASARKRRLIQKKYGLYCL